MGLHVKLLHFRLYSLQDGILTMVQPVNRRSQSTAMGRIKMDKRRVGK